MKLELQDEKGLTGVFIELPLEQLKEEIGLANLSAADPSATEALKVEVQSFEAQLKEKGEEIAKLEARTMDDFTPVEKANFVITWAKGISLEDKAIFAEVVGIPIAKATEAEVAEAVEEPKIIQGKTDKPGYKYLEHLNLSVRE